MMKKVIPVLLFFLSTAVPLTLWAEEADAVVIYGEGYSFSLSRDGSETYYDVVYDDVVGMGLYAGDYISTDEGTFLEIQLTSSENLLKISENTSFQIASVSGSGGGTFDLTYGRVRGKVAKLFGDDEFRIQGQSVVAGVRGTDFGYDIIVDRIGEGEKPETKSVAQVYCFDGKVEVAKTKEPSESITIETNQMVSFSPEKAVEPVEFAPRDVSEEIRQFWSVNDFLGDLIEYPEIRREEPEEKKEIGEKKETKEPAGAEPDKIPEEEPQIFSEEELARRAAIRKGFLAAGTSLVSVGVLTEIAAVVLMNFGEQIFPNAQFDYLQVGNILTYTGAGIVVTGILTYLGAAPFK
jgi:hypothetical protein